MKYWIMIAALGLSGCAGGIFDPIWERQNLTFQTEDETYLVRVQSDPVDFTYFNRITNPTFSLSKEDREAVIKVVEDQVGAEICESGKMELESILLDRFPNGEPVRFLESLGAYQIVSKCVY